MIDPRLYPHPAKESVFFGLPGVTQGQLIALADVGTSAKRTLEGKLVTEILFSHANAATVALSGPIKPGMILTAKQTGSGTADHKIALPAGCTWDGTNGVATIAAQHKYFTAIAISPTRFVVLAVDTVAFGTS